MIDVASTIEGVQLPIIARLRIGAEELFFWSFVQTNTTGGMTGEKLISCEAEDGIARK